jgi:hypothetical protein
MIENVIFLYNFSLKISSFEDEFREISQPHIPSVFTQSARYSCRILMKIEFSRKIFEKYSDIKFHENLSGGNRVVPTRETGGQTDKHDDANSRFSQFCEKRL